MDSFLRAQILCHLQNSCIINTPQELAFGGWNAAVLLQKPEFSNLTSSGGAGFNMFINAPTTLTGSARLMPCSLHRLGTGPPFLVCFKPERI